MSDLVAVYHIHSVAVGSGIDFSVRISLNGKEDRVIYPVISGHGLYYLSVFDHGKPAVGSHQNRTVICYNRTSDGIIGKSVLFGIRSKLTVCINVYNAHLCGICAYPEIILNTFDYAAYSCGSEEITNIFFDKPHIRIDNVET